LSVLVGIIAYFMLDSTSTTHVVTQGRATVLTATIDSQEGKDSPLRDGDGRSRWKMLVDPKLILFCWIYFAIQLSIYANTFWLPSIVEHPGTNDITVGLLSSLPWILRRGRHVSVATRRPQPAAADRS